MCSSKKLDLGIRPKCSKVDCENDCQFMGSYNKDGNPRFRKYCGSCHSKITAGKRGLKSLDEVVAINAGFSSVREYYIFLAKQKGFKSHTEYVNSKHPSKKHRKDYCENIDGRLGFNCTTNVFWDGMLDVDHIDGNPANNHIENLQTLCKCCHAYKSIINEDYRSPGRKQLNIKY